MILYTTAIYRPNFLWFFKAASPSLLWGSGHQRHAWGNSTRPIANTRGVHQQMSQRHCLAQRLCFLAPLDLNISWNFVSGSCAAEHEARQQVKGRLIIFIIELKGNVYMILHDPLKLEHARNQSCFSDNVHVHTDSAVCGNHSLMIVKTWEWSGNTEKIKITQKTPAHPFPWGLQNWAGMRMAIRFQDMDDDHS